MNWCILIPLIVGLICALLGYLLGKFLSKNNEKSNDCSKYKARITKLETDLDACNKRKIATVVAPAATSVATPPAAVGTVSIFNAVAAKAAYGKKVKEDDLTVVEGIGPKIKELFHNHNITTWAALANTSVEKCKEVLNSGGERFKMHVPRTWPKQAKLASEGKWAELLKWQDELDGGK